MPSAPRDRRAVAGSLLFGALADYIAPEPSPPEATSPARLDWTLIYGEIRAWAARSKQPVPMLMAGRTD